MFLYIFTGQIWFGKFILWKLLNENDGQTTEDEFEKKSQIEFLRATRERKSISRL